MAGQTRRASFAEACANTAIGYVISVGAQLAIFPACGVACSIRQNLAIGAAFTAVSLVRGYVLRRVFNRATGQK